MSSEVRLKKLRGSGGYVMAKITDQQQVKGNLGGPDLFLAPVGRLDLETITKHFCNACEKEFEGAPKVDYETPNEEVAQNLVLRERGQYICKGCGSTIAEYREFVKSDEKQDVGLAKPMDEGKASSPPPPPPPAKPQPEQAPAPEQQQRAAATAAAKPESATESSVNSIEGMTVFDEAAKKIGVAKQVGVNTEQKVVLIIVQANGDEAAVPWNRVKTVGDVILLGSPDPAAASQQQQQQAAQGGGPGGCPACGFANKSDAKFCEECGGKLQSG